MINSDYIGGRSPAAGEMIYPASPLHFRALKAEEVSVRPITDSGDSVRVLVYKDPRADRRILDETVGELNWQSDYYEEHNMLFCKIGIRRPDTGEWIWKADTGSESNIESEKGLASDAFKRAAFAFGVGKELYTLPQIRIKLNEKDKYNGKVSQSFSVSEMTVDNGYVSHLTIVDKWGETRFDYYRNASSVEPVRKEQRPRQEQLTHSQQPEQYVYKMDPLDPNLTYNFDEPDVPSPSEHRKESPRNNMIKDFCSRKKTEPGVDLSELRRFYYWYTGPDSKDPSKSKVETFRNPIPEQMWDDWLKKKGKKQF